MDDSLVGLNLEELHADHNQKIKKITHRSANYLPN